MTSSTPAPSFDELASRLAAFAAERDWDQFHAPKNLAMALAGEVGELLEHFQWLTEEQSRDLAPEQREAVALEMADVLLYLVRLADKLQVDLVAAAHRKIGLNAGKYPIAEFKGSRRKYDQARGKSRDGG
jgi:NTP pyrophosphatase (non-canonical NTP hydrolase)